MFDQNEKKNKFAAFWIKNSKKIAVISAIIIGLFLVCGGYLYWWYNYGTIARVGDLNITRQVVLQNESKYEKFFTYINDQSAKTDLEKATYEKLLLDKSVIYRAQANSVVITQPELNAEIVRMSGNPDTEIYYRLIQNQYGWDKADADEQLKIRMLKNKMQNDVVTNYTVNYLYVRYDFDRQDGKTAEQLKSEALVRTEKALVEAKSGVSLTKVADEIGQEADWSHPASGGNTLSGLNDETAVAQFPSPNIWESIKSLNNVGDFTNVIDASDKGGYFVVLQLSDKSSGQFISWNDFSASFEKHGPIDSFLKAVVKRAYACKSWTFNSDHRAVLTMKLKDEITGALITTNVKVSVSVSDYNDWCTNSNCDATVSQWTSDGTAGQVTFGRLCCTYTYKVTPPTITGYNYHNTRKEISDPGPNTVSYDSSGAVYFKGENSFGNVWLTSYYYPAYTLTLNIDSKSKGSGSVKTPAGAIDCNYNGSTASGECANTYVTSTTYAQTSLEALAGIGSTFGGFSGPGCTVTGNTCSFTMDQNRTITAIFNLLAEYKLTVNVDPVGAATASGAGNYLQGVTATAGFKDITAPYVFDQWTGDIGCGSPMIMASDKTCTAHLKAPVSSCKITATPSSGISPLVVKVTVTSTNGSTSFDYNMGDAKDSNGAAIGAKLSNKPSTIYYNYASPGIYKIVASSGATICEANFVGSDTVSVSGLPSGSGGEVSP